MVDRGPVDWSMSVQLLLTKNQPPRYVPGSRFIERPHAHALSMAVQLEYRRRRLWSVPACPKHAFLPCGTTMVEYFIRDALIHVFDTLVPASGQGLGNCAAVHLLIHLRSHFVAGQPSVGAKSRGAAGTCTAKVGQTQAGGKCAGTAGGTCFGSFAPVKLARSQRLEAEGRVGGQ